MIGSRLGPYEITAKLGEGGMGEVYRATDTNLKRSVAIKVLPAAFTEDKERLARFEREAQLLAQLHHPNIASIFGLEESGGVRALVMELVEGPTLAERLEAERLPMAESLSIALQIASALEEAHEKGIVHRDLKPQNIKAPMDGKVKVLDFGLAKAMDPDAGSTPAMAALMTADLARSPTLMNSPTLTAVRGTQLGMILGTAAYMAPEQARGGAVDKRVDIWAFGVVLFEMLTGRQLFEGESVTDTIAAVMRQEIDWSLLPAETRPRVRHLLARCLTRDRKQRLHDIGDARLELEEATAVAEARPRDAAVPEPSRPRARWLWPALGAAGLAAGVVAIVWSAAQRPEVPPPYLLSVVLPADLSLEPTGGNGGPVIVSPSGTRIAFCARQGRGPTALWVRSLDDSTARPIAGTEGASHPFWSPDEKFLGYFSDLHLRTVGIDGGPVTTLAPATESRGGSWSSQGVILFAPDYTGPIYSVPAAGGQPVAVTQVDTAHGEDTNRYPCVLPDGAHFLFLGRVGWKGSLYLGSLGSSERRLVVEDVANAAYGAGHLLFARNGALMAQPFDGAKLTLAGAARPVVEHLLIDERYSLGVFSVSSGGLLAFQTGREVRLAQLSWVDRAGRRDPVPTEPQPGPGSDCPPRISPDRKHVLLCRPSDAGTTGEIWELDVERGTQRALTRTPHDAGTPLWSGDGETVYFGGQKQESMPAQILRRRPGREPEVVYGDDTSANLYPTAISPDGRFLVIDREVIGQPDNIFRLDLQSPASLIPLFPPGPARQWGDISPDGKRLAFMSEESGRLEIYVSGFPEPSGVLRVSRAGGVFPRWRGDGTELYFRDAENWMVAAEIVHQANGELAIGRQTRLFQSLGDFTVTPDGQRFLIQEPLAASGVSPITIDNRWLSKGTAGAR